MNLGQRIKKYRKKLGMTQHVLAEKANISRSYLGDIENGRYNPSINTLESIADVLGVSLDRLLGESAGSIIENRLNELNMTLSDLAEQVGVKVEYLNKIDDIYPDEYDYLIMERIAKVLKIEPNRLINALARQEPPITEKQLQEWDRLYNKDGKLAEEVTALEVDDDLRAIARARKKMDTKDKEKMMQILKLSFEEYFDDSND